MGDNRNVFFDLIRGVSAVIVMLSHLRNAMFLDFAESKTTQNLFSSTFYFLTGLGHQAVMIFFVLSGFFVGGSVLSKNEKFIMIDYLIARVTRLWVVLIPALIFTFCVDSLINVISSNVIQGVYLEVLNSGPAGNYSVSILNFFSNLFFLQTIFTPVYGTNGPLWSLSNEFWYYILFPLMFIIFKRVKYKALERSIAILLIFILSIFLSDKLEGFLIWLFGVLVYKLYKSNYSLFRNMEFFSVIIFICSIVDSKMGFIEKYTFFSSDIFIGSSFSFFLYSIKNSIYFQIKNRYLKKFSMWISDISFTLYVFHFPLVILVFSVMFENNLQSLNSSSFAQFVIISILLVLLSNLFWFLFEKRTSIVRDFSNKLFAKIKFWSFTVYKK